MSKEIRDFLKTYRPRTKKERVCAQVLVETYPFFDQFPEDQSLQYVIDLHEEVFVKKIARIQKRQAEIAFIEENYRFYPEDIK